jgi:hypothetical protein
VRDSWSMTILLCTRKGRPNRMFEHSPGAMRAHTGLEDHALLREESDKNT